MFKNMTLGQKIIAGFSVVTLITACMGAFGYYGINQVMKMQSEVADVRLPSIQSLMMIGEAHVAVKSAERTLNTPDLPMDRVEREYKHIADELALAEKAWKIYEPLPQSKEEEATWKQFVPAWGAWKNDAMETIKLSQKYRAGGDSGAYKQLKQHTLEVSGKSFRTAEALLSKLVDINDKIAKESAKSADTESALIKGVMVSAVVAVIMLAMFIGLYLKRNIAAIIKSLLEESNRLTEAAVEGRLATRGDVEKINFEFRGVVEGVNQTLDAVIGPLNVAGEYVDRISKGDIPPRITDEYKGDFNEIKNNLNQCIDAVNALVADANMLSDAAVAGRLTTRADASAHRGDFRKIVEGVNDTIDRLVGFLDNMSAPAMVIDKDFSILYMNEMGAKAGGKTQQQMLGGKCYDHFKTSDCRTERCACARAIANGQVSTAETDAHPMAGLDLDISYTGVPIKDRQGNVTGAFEVVTDLTAVKTAARVADKQAKYQEEEVGKLLANLEKMAIGDLNIDTACLASDEDTLAIARNFEKINASIKQNIQALDVVTNAAAQIALGNLSVEVRERSTHDQLMQALTRMVATLRELATTAEHIAGGDLTVNVKPASENDAIGNAFAVMVGNLREIVGNVGSSTDSIATATKQIATGNADMAQRSETQASSLEEIASSMEELTSTVKQNADNSQQANQLAIDASDVAVKGGTVINRVVDTMDSISASSKKIADIISVIDGIAFQTNILALNAAVEAARAGEQGRGFAVVAGEVRNLAQRSAAAAKEIKELISDSVDKVGNGSKLVGEAGQTMQEIVTSIKRVTDIMGEISAASIEQSSGIEQVNTAITSMDEITQQNASVVQQASAAAGALEDQAGLLVDAVNRFKLDDQRASAVIRKHELAPVQAQVAPKVIRQAKGVDKVGKASGYHKANGYHKESAPLAKVVGADEEWGEF
ncbi:MAG: hypothetical protein A2076_15025 [Geobacteraceae bacterium GWC2_53_11]|nr:MAG: hypothetical protein A2076_15025 [Geobacteraceae bacterium GWC2_53_11]